MLSNGQIAEVLGRMMDEEPAPHRRRALQRAARAAIYSWPAEAAALVEAGESLTALLSVGPWLANIIARLLEDPGFGKVFSDHMVTARWRPDTGWGLLSAGRVL